MNNFDNQFEVFLPDSDCEQSFSSESDNIINLNEQPLGNESYFSQNAYEQLLGNESYFSQNAYEQPLGDESYFSQNAYEQPLGDESYFSQNAYEQPLTSELVDYTVTDFDNTFQYPQISTIFTAGLEGIENIADKQEGPTCGFESIENILQLYNPQLTNDTSNILQQYPQLNNNGSLNLEFYDDILQSQGISSSWSEFDQQKIASALFEHRPVVVVVDAHDLDSTTYTEDNAWHAITLTKVDYDDNGHIIGYRGIDSNFPREEKVWSADVLEKASNEWRNNQLANNQQTNQQVLIPDQAALAWGNLSQNRQIA